MRKLFFAVMLLVATHASASVEAIVNDAITHGVIAREDARRVFMLRERYTPEGAKITLFRLPLTSSIHKRFVRDVLGMTDRQFEKEWQRIVNAGLEGEIKEVPTQKAMMSAVSTKAFGVGYLDQNYVVLSIGGSGAKIIRIVD